MRKRKRWLAGIECLQRQVQHHRRVLADGIQHDGAFKFGGDFADDVDAFRFQEFEVGQFVRVHLVRGGLRVADSLGSLFTFLASI